MFVPPARRERATELGLRTTKRWAGGDETDLTSALGEGWYFTAGYDREERDWCDEAYLEADESPD